MIAYVCKNHDSDGDLFLAVFTTKALAEEFCQAANATNRYCQFVFYPVKISDDATHEFNSYSQGVTPCNE